MKIIVTGAAGFIGSHLCESLLANGKHSVVGIDTFIGPSPLEQKQRNLAALSSHPRFTFINGDLMTLQLEDIFKETDVIYHLAAIPGVRSSWGTEFDPYVRNNILVTQRLLEACKDLNLKKFIYISTSSVYGEKSGMVSEAAMPEPLSPYGITKLTGEYLCRVYQKAFDLPLVILRYFTVYGPRQRPDMSFHRFIKQIMAGHPITVFGDGLQTRDFTFIEDCIKATSSVMDADHVIGETINIGGLERASVLDIIRILERITGKTAALKFMPAAIGEPKHTWADILKAGRLLGYSPSTSLETGLQLEWEDLKTLYGVDSS